ncbi:glycoside hydrolase family 172 protein [Candidatus Hydrogenedentota bacterium]
MDNSWATLKDGRSKRISSYNRLGGNKDKISLGAGETVDIAVIEGPGIINHIWFTINSTDPMIFRNMVLRMYWDGEEDPSVESPLGDFFGQGWGEAYSYAALPISASPRRSGNIYMPMPFAVGARIELENDSEHDLKAFYYYVDYEERDSVDDMGRFHASWARKLNRSVEGQELQNSESQNLTDEYNHIFIDAEGRGHFAGLNYYVDCPAPQWYGEGDDMFFIDGEPWPPSLHGTGTEDYFNSSYCPKEIYVHPYFGYARVNDNIGFLGRTHCYRFHKEDPIIFRESLRGSIECSHANASSMDIVTVAYWYQTEPHKPFPALPDREGRQNMPEISSREIMQWRLAWQQMGEEVGTKWGDEQLGTLRDDLREQAESLRKKLAPDENIKLAEAEATAYEKMLNRRKRK